MAILRARLFPSEFFPGFMSHFQKRAKGGPSTGQIQVVAVGGPAIRIVEFGGAIGALKAMTCCSGAQFISAIFTAYSAYLKVTAPY
ncbi:MAG: hypothetical protein ACN6OQ_01395 [Paraburkholderia nemoris]